MPKELYKKAIKKIDVRSDKLNMELSKNIKKQQKTRADLQKLKGKKIILKAKQNDLIDKANKEKKMFPESVYDIDAELNLLNRKIENKEDEIRILNNKQNDIQNKNINLKFSRNLNVNKLAKAERKGKI
tara:strand:+ start:865 stop:1251 length:387 start_codon:yes stop_codon:yes gene_type:complete